MTILEKILEDYEVLYTVKDFTQIWPSDWLRIMARHPRVISDFEDKIPWEAFERKEIYELESYNVYVFSLWKKSLSINEEYDETYNAYAI